MTMATRYGLQTFNWLVQRGWKPAPLDPGVLGDPMVVDPITNQKISVYAAAIKQRAKTGEYPEFLPITNPQES